MITKEEYLLNPCGTLSIPYWKNKTIIIPSNIAIIHKKNFKNQFDKHQRFFRLLHLLESIDIPKIKVETINLDTDKIALINMLNTCYKNLNISVNEKDILELCNHPTYINKLWIKIEENETMIASGIAEYDEVLNEGILEWIQVLPEYQNKGYGKTIVNSLLIELKKIGAKFVTVSGDLDNNTNPEKLYRNCGFIGDDIWYICTADLNYKLKDLQPSQLYISEEKISKIKEWFNPNDLSNFEPIPIKIINAVPVIIDSHTRCVCAILSGLEEIPLQFEKEEWDWDMYDACINECKAQNITSSYDLISRIISKEDYEIKWNKWCDEMQEKIISSRK